MERKRQKGKARAKGDEEGEDDVQADGAHAQKTFSFIDYLDDYYQCSGLINMIPEDSYVALCSFYSDHFTGRRSSVDAKPSGKAGTTVKKVKFSDPLAF